MSDKLQLETTLHFVTLWARKTIDGKVILMTTSPEDSIAFVGDDCDDDDFLEARRFISLETQAKSGNERKNARSRAN